MHIHVYMHIHAYECVTYFSKFRLLYLKIMIDICKYETHSHWISQTGFEPITLLSQLQIAMITECATIPNYVFSVTLKFCSCIFQWLISLEV